MSTTTEVDRIMADGATALDPLAIDGPTVRAWVARRLDGEEASARLDAAEVLLAAACAAGNREALAHFERRYFADVPAALGRLSLSADDVAEVVQRLRIRLLVADGDAAPRVLGYAGAGQLGGLVRVTAIRLGLNLLRDRGRLAVGDDGLEDVPIAADDPALARLKAQHRSAFKQAFEDAIAGLEPRERSLLSLALVKGLGVDKIGVLYGVHRATAARWVQHARGNLTRAVHATLASRLGIARGEVDDLLPLVESQLELSLARLLRTQPHA